MFKDKHSSLYSIEDFFQGKIYPLIICSAILIAQIFSLEHIIIPAMIVLAAISFLICKSIKPLIAPLCAFMYSLSLENLVFGPNSTDYYFTGWRLIAIFVLAILIVCALAVFFCRIRLIRRLQERKTPGLIPLLLLCAAFMLNGSGSEYWHPANALFGLAQVAAYLIVFIIFYHGFSEDETSDELTEYFAYICALITVVLAAELIHVYLTNDVIVDGVIKRDQIRFGWGICNNLGVCANILIPMNFYGAYRSKRYSIFYFAAAVTAFLTAVFSISRNGLLIGTVIFTFCAIIFCCVGDRKRFFRICTAVFVVALAACLLVFRNEITLAFKSYFDRGFTDDSRISLWKNAWKHFKTAPLFGNGFKAPLLFSEGIESFTPLMAHNTIFEICFAMGGFGIASYILYRISTVIPFIKKPSMMKTSLGLLILTLLAASLLDNFTFHVYPVFFYSIAMAIAQKDRCDAERYS